MKRTHPSLNALGGFFDSLPAGRYVRPFYFIYQRSFENHMRNLYAAYEAIKKAHVRSAAVLVYYDLCSRANQDNECWPSKKTIAAACRVSVSTVTRALRELETSGMIATVYRFRASNNKQTSNIYRVFETPRQFTQNPDQWNPSAVLPPKQEVFYKVPDKDIPAACEVQLPESVMGAEQLPEAYGSDFGSEPQDSLMVSEKSDGTSICAEGGIFRNCSPAIRRSELWRLISCLLLSRYDTLPHVMVTPQGIISGRKDTDNLRKKSIFSKITKWHQRKRRKKDAGLTLESA